jgi:Holliday junction DNA helicase RuvA
VIGWLSGPLVAKRATGELVVEAGGVGYVVQVPASVLACAPEPGGRVELFVHTHVRDDAICLFGFQTERERRTFELLLATHGIGPSLALSILSVLGPDALVRAVVDEDVDALSSVPGVGRKTAARLVLELRQRLGAMTEGPRVPASSSLGEVRAALAELGYGASEIGAVLARLPAEGTTEALLRAALRELAGALR